MSGILEPTAVVVLGVGHLVHPRRQVGSGVVADLVGERGVHGRFDRQAAGEIVGSRPGVGRVGLLGQQGVQALGESLIAFGHRPQDEGELRLTVDIGLLGEVLGPGHRSRDLAQSVAQCVDRVGAFGLGHRRYSRAPVTAALNVPAVRRGAIICLVIAAPAAVVQRLLADDDGGTDQSNWVFVALLAIVVAYLVGGAVAGRRSPSAPFINGATATLSAFLVVQVIAGIVRIVQGDGLSLVGIVFNALLAATIGVVGAGFGIWRGTLEDGGGEPAG